MIRRAAALGIMMALLSAPAGSRTSIDQKIQAQRAKAQALHERLQQKRSELHAAQVRVGNLQAQLDETNGAIASVNARLGDLDAQTRSTERRLAWNSLQLSAAKATLKRHSDALNHRLVDIYEHGDLGYLDVLLSATSFADFAERWDDLRLLVAANQRTIRSRRDAERRVSGIEFDLERTQIALQAARQEQQRARNQLDTLASERGELVSVADEQRRHVASEVAQMEDLSAEEEAQLEALIQERERELAAERQAAGIAGNEGEAPGSLSWPVSGTITSPFGLRHNPFGGGMEFHQGL
ncbi:MAG: hypothetical protein JO104_12470, partial [Candidatus Eremiobacteraeota bacterium]|nr:hypothetical protein [Candidatus Eremiobacteraeota bacterium]